MIAAGLIVLTGCTSSPQMARDPEVSAAPSSVQSATSSSSGTEPTTSVAATCDPVARGSAGVPTAADEPMLALRYSSYWSPTMRLAPALVIYRSGAIALARFGGNDGSDPRSGDGSPSPFRSYLGGRLSQCALDELMAEFDTFVGVDFGDANVSDCTIADFQRFTSYASFDPTVISIDGFGCESIVGGAYPTEGEQGVQYAARARLVNWVERASRLRGGRGLPMDRVLLVDGEEGYPYASNKKAIEWTAETLERKQYCRLLTGSSATDALALVAASITANPGSHPGSFVYTADWLVGGRERAMGVMLAPPGVDCGRT